MAAVLFNGSGSCNVLGVFLTGRDRPCARAVHAGPVRSLCASCAGVLRGQALCLRVRGPHLMQEGRKAPKEGMMTFC